MTVKKISFKKVMLRAMIAFAAGGMVIAIIGCSNKIESEVASPPAEIPAQEEFQDITSEKDAFNHNNEGKSVGEDICQEKEYKLFGYAQSFSEGFAWVGYKDMSDESSSRFGCIDKEGKVIFSLSTIHTPSAFDEGYSYVSNGDRMLYAIATDGTVTKYGDKNNEKVRILAYGGGYVVVGRYEASFDSDKYVFEIQDAKAQVVESFSLEGDDISDKETGLDTLPQYCGKGVFGFQMEVNGGLPTDFYCCKSKKWVKEAASEDVRFVGESDTALLAIKYGDPGEQLVFMTSDGEISQYIFPENVGNLWDACVSDGKCVIHDFDGHFYVYDLSLDTLKQMPFEHEGAIKTEFYTEGKPFFREGLCVLVATGADGDTYFEVFDQDWNRKFDPVKAVGGWEFMYYSDGLLVADPKIEQGSGGFTDQDSAVYDVSGKQLWMTDGYLSPMSDGLFLHAKKGGFGVRAQQMHLETTGKAFWSGNPIDYLDKNGKPAFESLDCSSAKEIVLD